MRVRWPRHSQAPTCASTIAFGALLELATFFASACLLVRAFQRPARRASSAISRLSASRPWGLGIVPDAKTPSFFAEFVVPCCCSSWGSSSIFARLGVARCSPRRARSCDGISCLGLRRARSLVAGPLCRWLRHGHFFLDCARADFSRLTQSVDTEHVRRCFRRTAVSGHLRIPLRTVLRCPLYVDTAGSCYRVKMFASISLCRRGRYRSLFSNSSRATQLGDLTACGAAALASRVIIDASHQMSWARSSPVFCSPIEFRHELQADTSLQRPAARSVLLT